MLGAREAGSRGRHGRRSDEAPRPRRPRPDRSRRWRVPVAPILSGLIVALLGGSAAYVLVVDDPLAGEPHAIVRDRAAGTAAGSGGCGRCDAGLARPPRRRRRSAAEVEDASGVSIMRPNGSAAPGAVIIRVPEPENGKLAPAPDSRLVERSRHGLLPKVGADGAKPWRVYARPAGAAGGRRAPGARIALLVTGLGISPSATAGAIAQPSARRDPRLRALRRRSRQDRGGARGARATRSCSRCRWSRSTIRTTIPGRTR